MTFERKIQSLLEENGMFPAQASAVIAAYKANKANAAMDRWNDHVDDYPPAMLAVIWMGIQSEALKWIDANLPQAWFRPMFLSEAEREALFAEAGI